MLILFVLALTSSIFCATCSRLYSALFVSIHLSTSTPFTTFSWFKSHKTSSPAKTKLLQIPSKPSTASAKTPTTSFTNTLIVGVACSSAFAQYLIVSLIDPVADIAIFRYSISPPIELFISWVASATLSGIFSKVSSTLAFILLKASTSFSFVSLPSVAIALSSPVVTPSPSAIFLSRLGAACIIALKSCP